ncbi:AraC family transcriptional regulator [Heliomarina baculiformis]|uniref:AraC family transcriptional regulator n=1 Tax=Heliomarina baculiformis TaxID=2872036 RepID=UPI001EE36C3F|nr:AraC family transcriptional regulator [Heliomarina baculiformis]
MPRPIANPPPVPSLRAAALAPILRHFGNDSDTITSILRQNGINSEAVRDPYEIISLAAYLKTFEAAAHHAHDPILGARLGTRISPADLGPIGLLMLHSSTLRRGLERFRDSLSALQSATEMHLIDDGDRLGLSYQLGSPGFQAGAQDAEFSLSCICRLVHIAFDPRWTPEEVHFIHGPSRRADLLERIFGARVRFGQSANRLLFRQGGLDTLHRVEDTALLALIERHVADLVLTQDPCRTIAEQVQVIVSRNLGHLPVDLATIAQELGQAPRSLQRHLASEGTSLRAILQAQRQKIVETHLDDPNASLKTVAQSLGYSDETVFWRAYRSWTGHAPSKRNQAG